MSAEKWGCGDFERNLFPYVQGKLAVADAVRAQVHLATCAQCTALSAQWVSFSEVILEHQVPPLSRDHSARLVDSILADVDEVATTSAPRRRSRGAFAVAGGVLAAAAAIIGFVVFMRAPVVPVEHEPAQAVLGALSVGSELSVGEPVVAGRVQLSSAAGARVHVEGSADKPRIVVDRGSVRFEVTPLAGGQELEACTDTTCARVIGTIFEVTRGLGGDRVAVIHGAVAVYPESGGSELVLHAGEAYETPWSRRAVAALAPSAPGTTADVVSPRASLASEPKGGPAVDPAPRVVRCPASFNEAVLAKLGEDALQCLDGADAAHLMSVAEAMLARGAQRDAEAVFHRLLDRFPASRDADYAAYSFALIAADTGRDAVARERLERYLARSPRGAFAADAAWRSAMLLTRGRQLKAAALRLEQVVELSPSSSRRAEALFLLGSIYDRELDNHSGALVAYRRAMAEPSATPDIKSAAESRLQEMLRR